MVAKFSGNPRIGYMSVKKISQFQSVVKVTLVLINKSTLNVKIKWLLRNLMFLNDFYKNNKLVLFVQGYI